MEPMLADTAEKLDSAEIPTWQSGELCGAVETRSLVRDIFVMTSDRWSMPVIRALSEGPVRFTGLMADVEGVSHRMLTRTLRSLERDGLVSRTSYPESPPRVEYALTSLGETFTEPIFAFVSWAAKHQHEIEASRARFDG